MKTINISISSAAVVVFPASTLALNNVYGAVFLIVIFLGLWQIIVHPKQSFNVSRDESLFFFSLAFIMISVLLTSFVNHTGIARADRFMAPVLAIPTYIYFKRYPPSIGCIWLGLLAGAFISASVAIYQVFGEEGLARAGGDVNPIMFGDISLILGAMSLASIDWMKSRHKLLVVVPILALLAGLIASVLSQSRGGWVAIPFLTILFAWYFKSFLSFKVILVSLLIFILLLSGLYFSPEFGAKQRIDTALNDTELYFDSNNVNDPIRSNSVGVRFEMWKAAIIIFLDNPFTGAGWGNFKTDVNKLIENGRINKTAGHYYHAHNQFFSALAKGGLIGFAGIVIIFLVPGLIFFKYLNCSGDVKNIALAGLILVVGFVTFSMTEAILERAKAINFYSFYLAVFTSYLIKKELLTQHKI